MLPRRRRAISSEPVCCRKSIKCCGAKMHSQPVSVSPRTLCTGRGETPREEEGAPPRPQQPLHGHCKAQLTSPRAFQGRPDARVRHHRLYWDSACAQQARRGWDRVTARKPRVISFCAKPPRCLCSLCQGGRGWLVSGVLPPLPASLCLCAWGTEGLWACQRDPGRDVRRAGPCVVPRIANPRNHR